MLRRAVVLLAALTAAGFLATGAAGAASVDRSPLSEREQAGLEFASQVLQSLVGGSAAR